MNEIVTAVDGTVGVSEYNSSQLIFAIVLNESSPNSKTSAFLFRKFVKRDA